MKLFSPIIHRYREDHPEIKRNDMLDIMIDCLKSEVAKGEETSEGKCMKIGFPGKLILGKRKGRLEIIFSCKYHSRIDFPGRMIFIELPLEDMHEDDQFERDSKLTTDINGKKEFDELLIVATALVVTIAGT